MKKALMTLALTAALAGGAFAQGGTSTAPKASHDENGDFLIWAQCSESCIRTYDNWTLLGSACLADCYLTLVKKLLVFWE